MIKRLIRKVLSELELSYIGRTRLNYVFLRTVADVNPTLVRNYNDVLYNLLVRRKNSNRCSLREAGEIGEELNILAEDSQYLAWQIKLNQTQTK